MDEGYQPRDTKLERDVAEETPPATGPKVRPTLWRGLRRRCPHCGRGHLFRRWVSRHAACSECGLVYVRNQGDLWLYWILMDRVPLALGIASIFFGFRVTGWLTGLVFFLAIAGPLVATMPQRMGVAIALNYLTRVYFRDPSDELPD